MSVAVDTSPLVGSALALVQDGATAGELVRRFGAAGAAVTGDVAQDLLDELSRIGLVQVARGSDDDRTYVLTRLGHRVLGLALAGHRDQADLLAELERMRTDLLPTIAHELRTPLTAVRTSVGLLLDPASQPSADQRRTLLERIQRNGLRMQRLVEDILDLTRFRAGGIQLQLRRFDAVELAQSAIASVASLAEKRGQRIELKAPTGPVWVFADHRRLEQALVNLISNAEKYSPEGARLSVSVSSIGSDIQWAVGDQGPGIDVADQARLFERFFVGRNDRSGATSGVGLGLAITLAIVQAHGGRIDVLSQLGQGSTFTMVVPSTGPEEHAEQ